MKEHKCAKCGKTKALNTTNFRPLPDRPANFLKTCRECLNKRKRNRQASSEARRADLRKRYWRKEAAQATTEERRQYCLKMLAEADRVEQPEKPEKAEPQGYTDEQLKLIEYLREEGLKKRKPVSKARACPLLYGKVDASWARRCAKWMRGRPWGVDELPDSRARPRVSSGMRRCTKCLEVYALSEEHFRPSNVHPLGLHTWCRGCERGYDDFRKGRSA